MAQIRKHALLTVGLTAASVAGTVLLGPASSAQASGVNWDAVAQCESGGDWSISTGNGFRGGLQFDSRTWNSHGGRKYASSANRASKSEQIRIAEKVLRSQGIGAWPTCGQQGGSSKRHKGTHTNGSGSASHKSSTTKWHRKTTHNSTTRATTNATTERVATKKASSYQVPRSTTVKATGENYVVRSGDHLAAIASKNNVDGGWRTLYALNDDTISNPDLIFPGQQIAL